MDPITLGGGRIVAYNADCRDVLRHLAEAGECVHAMHSDPPYHLTSIVKRFGKDGAAPAAHGTDGAFARAARGFMGKEWDGGDVAFDPETWRLHLDALLPGGYLTAFASSRGFGRMSVAIEDAGFVTHPMLGWIFGSGMPKATRLKTPDADHLRYGGQALKPALEPIFMGQKPMEGTGTANWLAHGTGALNIDASRTPTAEIWKRSKGNNPVRKFGGMYAQDEWTRTKMAAGASPRGSDLGGWPANVVHDGSPSVISELDDSARFFYQAKAAAEDRWFWCQVCGTAGPARAMGDHQHDRDDLSHIVSHPTVKPLALARWLVRLTCPTRGQTVFDGFAGTGTTGVACIAEGRRAILCERDPDYFRILVARCRHYLGEGEGCFARASAEGRHTAYRRDAGPVRARITIMSAVADIRPGVAFAVSQLRRLAADALREQPTDQTRHLCLTDAAQRLERAALQQGAAHRADLFTPQPAKAAE